MKIGVRIGSAERSSMPIPMGFRRIAEDLHERIRRGEYPPGSRLPSYRELKEIYAPTSISTLQRAVGLLQEREVVVGVQGLGLYVAERDTRRR
jgi:GntR family transcriptional regulator